MPPAYVKTIREEILYEYAKLISRSIFHGNIDHPFVANRFKALAKGTITISGTNREWHAEQELPMQCVFCGSKDNLSLGQLIPVSRGGRDTSSGNTVLSCNACSASRASRGIFHWLGLKKKDSLDHLVAGEYLKQLFDLHERKGTLEINTEALTLLCPQCRNRPSCTQWNSIGELTCFCLESVF